MNWVYSIVRMLGTTTPFTSWLVQLQAELDYRGLNQRITKLEDPISNSHEDVPEIAHIIYREIKSNDSSSIKFEENFIKKYGRAIAALESRGYIKGKSNINSIYYTGITVIDPTFIVYLCLLDENQNNMQSLIETVNECPVGSHLKSSDLKERFNLPTPVVTAVFEIFEMKGFGICSSGLGGSAYIGRA